MALYDYSCRSCGGEFEKNVSIAERDKVNCDCGGSAFRRITFYGSVYAPTAGGMK